MKPLRETMLGHARMGAIIEVKTPTIIQPLSNKTKISVIARGVPALGLATCLLFGASIADGAKTIGQGLAQMVGMAAHATEDDGTLYFAADSALVQQLGIDSFKVVDPETQPKLASLTIQ